MSESIPHLLRNVDLGSVLALERLPDPRSVAYFSGSLVAGYGNSWSDLDVYVVGESVPIGPNVVKDRYTTISIHYTSSRRVDFEFWTRAATDRLADCLSRIEIGAAFADEYFSPTEEAFIHRLKIGFMPERNRKGLEGLQAKFDFEKFRMYLIQKSLRTADHLVEDVSGMIESGDFLQAVLTARPMIGAAVDAYCHWQGNTDPSTKWRLHHLRSVSCNLEQSRIVEEFLDLMFPPQSLKSCEPIETKRYTDTSLRFVNRIASLVQQ